jgi:hypothetical protein
MLCDAKTLRCSTFSGVEDAAALFADCLKGGDFARCCRVLERDVEYAADFRALTRVTPASMPKTPSFVAKLQMHGPTVA